MKTPIELYERRMGTISRCGLIQFLLFDCIKQYFFKDDKEKEPIMTLFAYIGLVYLLDCDYPLQYEVEHACYNAMTMINLFKTVRKNSNTLYFHF